MVNEQEIIAKAKRSMHHFTPLYTHYHKQILLFIYQRVNTKEKASDLTSQTFLKAMNNISKYEDRGFSFGSWLYKIALNEINGYYRKNSRVVNITDGILSTLFYEIKDEEEKTKENKLMRAIKQLKNSHFQFIEMRFFENRPFKEIAEILDITESNAKVTTYRAIDKLKALMTKS
jgi:RNA polymerase sigma-70 factor (ECF subfamily)